MEIFTFTETIDIYLRSKPLVFKDMGIRKSEFWDKTHFLYTYI